MGSYSDYCLKCFQDETGIVPARGDRAKAIRDLQEQCFEVIKVLQLELSGIREGMGYWCGSDVVGAYCGDLIEAADLVRNGPSDRQPAGADVTSNTSAATGQEASQTGFRPWDRQ